MLSFGRSQHRRRDARKLLEHAPVQDTFALHLARFGVGHAVSVNDRYEAAQIDVKRDEGVTVTYLDGYMVSFDLLTLRAGCPCATCRGIRDQGEEVWPRPSSPTPLRIVDARLHGAWGLAITWNDSHATGIFPFELLRRWHEAGREGHP